MCKHMFVCKYVSSFFSAELYIIVKIICPLKGGGIWLCVHIPVHELDSACDPYICGRLFGKKSTYSFEKQLMETYVIAKGNKSYIWTFINSIKGKLKPLSFCRGSPETVEVHFLNIYLEFVWMFSSFGYSPLEAV